MIKTMLFSACAGAILVGGCQSGGDAGSETSKSAASQGSETSKTAETPNRLPANFAQVKTIFEAKCIGCHGDKGKDGVDLRTYESIMKGGESGPNLVAGKPQESLLVHVLRASHGKQLMPFKQEPLPDDQIKIVEDWIRDGAKKS